jgi:glycosyltransferase involved in cell wall biosynthesis
MSAYACEPSKGSEPGVGWNMAWEMAKYHHIYVLTRANNRFAIERELTNNFSPYLHFIYYDLPKWVRLWKRGGFGVQFYYIFWQICAYFLSKDLHKKIGFDIVHHVTFVRYWTPSFVSLLQAPFVWGPVGGGEPVPKNFFFDFGLLGFFFELLRSAAIALGNLNPLVLLTAKKSKIALAASKETAVQLKKIGVNNAHVLCPVACSSEEAETIINLKNKYSNSTKKNENTVFISIGRLLHWKGYHLSLRAFAKGNFKNAEYWIVGDGPQNNRLKAMSKTLGISSQVNFLGFLDFKTMLNKLVKSDVLIHPSLHDPGATVIVEAMVAGKPVICLDLGGPAMQVTDKTGIRIPAQTPEQVVKDMAKAMRRLAKDASTRKNMGLAGRERVNREFSWEKKGLLINQIYNDHAASKLH